VFVETVQNNGIIYLRLVQSIRAVNDKGVRISKKKVIFNIGPLSRFDDGLPDYVARLKQSFKDGEPLIDSLRPYVESPKPAEYLIRFSAGDSFCSARPKRFAPCLLDPVFSALGLDQLFASIKHSSRIHYDLQGIVRLLTYGRILEPASKMATMKQNSDYYRPPVKSSNDDNVYDALDVIYDNRFQILRRMNTCICRGLGRNTDTIFYDVTNFFFEIESADDDVTDEDGSIIEKGLRKHGVSKENRKQPIVQAGLFLDDKGIPVSIELFPGNTLDQATLRTAMKNTVDNLKFERFILVSDRGIYSAPNMCHVIDEGNGYIVSKSLRKSTKTERKWAVSPEDYTVVSPDFRYKSRVVDRTVTDENGKSRRLKQKVVVYWSRSFCERERHENRSFLEFIEKLKANPAGFRITAAQSRSLKKFMKKEVVHKDTGEILDAGKLLSMIDEDKLTEFNDLMGLYQIVTSETEMDDLEIIERYHELTRIEDQFREMKGTLETRPVYVNTKEHIYAHMMICFMSLTMMRLIQYRITQAKTKQSKTSLNWTYGIPGARLAKALREWQVEQLSEEYYRMVNSETEDLKTILEAFGITIPKDLFTMGQLRSLSSKVKVF